ncbi:DUF4238 domain-containing protein [Paraliobacillus sp. X-1268]|uniref:DUF4238 domain-containing protein n=1 Tax=Paraliobacillus sp. X-1268 TaxID=2213193 RepID=UPI000E3DD7F6|nr:DUF4238 domain-containing protein [Paraliobacillus sp. X-1268]
MTESRQFVKREHYITQFSIRPFEITKGLCLTVNLKATPLEILHKRTEDIMQDIDLYEVMDNTGSYVNRNEMELAYRGFENYTAPKFRRLVSLLESEDADSEFNTMIKTNEWADKEATLLFHLILTLIRSPQVKNLVFDDEKIPEFLKPIFYRLLTTSQVMAVKLAKEHLRGNELEVALHFLKTSSESGLKTLAEHLMNNFQLRIYKTKGVKKLFLSDRPILIQEFKDTDYLLPISPNVCVGTTKLQTKGKKIFICNQIVYLSDDEVKNINQKIVKKAEGMLIIQKDSDIESVKEWQENKCSK